MEVTTVPQVQKKLFRNNTAGLLGVVKLTHRGEEIGENVDPFGYVWLSEEEAILTARAPRRPEDNPFEEWTLVGVDPETSATKEFKVRPLTLVTDEEARFMPFNERYVPTPDLPLDAAPAPVQHPALQPEPVPAPRSTGSAASQPPAPRPSQPPPSRPIETFETTTGQAGDTTWVQPPEAPGQVIAGALRGSDDAADAKSAPDPTYAPADHEPPSINAQAAPMPPGAVEEHAELVDPRIGEETGAARPPAQPPADGEYAQAEEVGSPDAPAVNHETQNGG